MKAIWNDTVIAESSNTKIVENNHYFPREDIKEEYFEPSNSHTRCPWKGKASYFSVKVNGNTNEDAAWYYPEASHAAKPIENYVAFWNGVKVTE
ncbi:DUF427 domain-containing protein [Christiangramia forsetii]|uniref:Protein containing DUF427 n=2 Tax=Christiangramia forsetii TaxID=411153 RepID=A0LY24_CHRFK|nr:DUF427 domain-containing protein [Christiangramia forsetii]GGG35167.1 hypothetical protein GCM10011532_18720 [Christiangramia forsetii]CAL65269.1 protein containing DUF427 [Christiangramia forsetii KT0803]